MRASAVAGLVFANINDELLKKLTAKRSMASVPFGARYRLIDFPLSNLVNAGISSVGIITKKITVRLWTMWAAAFTGI